MTTLRLCWNLLKELKWNAPVQFLLIGENGNNKWLELSDIYMSDIIYTKKVGGMIFKISRDAF